MEADARDAHVVVVVGTLIEAAADNDHAVRESVSASLRRIAKKHPSFVLKNAVAFRVRNPKLSSPHLIVLLQTMEQICREQLPDIDGDVVLQLIEFSVEEMTQSIEYKPDIQLTASGILVALGQAHCNEVMGGLLKQLQPGVVPHYAVLHTMGALASANVFGIVPFVKATLGTMLPMLGQLRIDAMKQVFSFTLGRFSEAISDYMANIDHAPDPTVKKEVFSSEISIAYDFLVHSWIQIREPKVIEAVLHAIGSMFPLLPPEKINNEMPKLIPVLLGLYRRNADPYPVTQCLSAVLHVSLPVNKNTVEPLIDNLQNTMFDLVCMSPDYAQPATAKNHSEILRCFDCLACHFLDKVAELLVQQMKNNNDGERIKALLVLTHLVNSSENVIRLRSSVLVNALRNMLGEHSMKVKKVLLKAIVAFAYRGYLDGNQGKEFVEFIVKHCCQQTIPNIEKDLSNGGLMEELQGICENTLYLLTTTVPHIENTLWQILQQCLLASQYTTASSHIARCLAHLATKRKDQLDLTENSQEINGPHVILGRCLALLGCPLKSGRGAYILQFLRNYTLNISCHLKPLWEQKIRELLSHLENSRNDWNDRLWDDLVLEFLSATLTEMDEEKWTMELGVTLMKHTSLYQSFPEERSMLYKCMAVIVCHITDAEFINHQLDVMLSAMRQQTRNEGKASARAVGICARKHLHLVLNKLENLGKEELNRKSSRFLGFMKSVKHEEEMDRVKFTLISCYGEIALEAPGVELLPQLEHSVTQWILQQLQTAKDLHIRETCLKTLGNIAEALHPNRNSLHIVLQCRFEALFQTLHQLRPQYSSMNYNTRRLELYPTTLKVVTALVKLPPALTPQERVSVLKTCFDRVYNATSFTGGDSSPEEETGDINECIDIRWAEHMNTILSSLDTLIQVLLLDSVSPATLDDIFTLLEPWLIKKNSCQKAAAIGTLKTVLQCYLNNMNFSFETPSKFSQSGLILGRVIPRCTDPSMDVRQEAVDCVRLVLNLAAQYEGHMADYDNEQACELSKIRKQVQTKEPNELFKVTNELAKIICAKLPHFQLIHFCNSLMEGLLDDEPSSSSGASVVLNVFLKIKGGELYHQVDDVLCNILERLTNIHCVQTRTGSMRAILALAHHHPKAVVHGLLNQPLPFDVAVAECWALLAQDATLSADIIEQFLQLINNSSLYDEQSDRDKLRIAALLPLSVICAMQEMFRMAAMQGVVMKKFPELFSILLIVLGCYVGTSPPVNKPQKMKGKQEKSTFVPNRNMYRLNPTRVAIETFKSFLLCVKCDQVAETLLQCAHLDAGDNITSFVEMVPFLTKALCAQMPQYIPRLVTCLSQYGTSCFEPQRIVVVAFYAELIVTNAGGQVVLLESIISNLLNCLNDPSPEIRRLCLKGLASVSTLPQEQKIRHYQPVLSALTQGLDDHDCNSNVSLEAMKGFSQMLQIVEEEHILNVQATVAIRIKPFFENEDPNVREAAFRMFGDLAKCGGASTKSAFQEQITGNLVCLLLHLEDNNQVVIKACKYALRQAGPLLHSDRINAMLQDHLIDVGNLHYSDFVADLVKKMVEELPELIPALVMSAVVYMKSMWPNIRGNAVMFVGHVYRSQPAADVTKKIPLDTVCARLIQLLQDEDQGVRAKAVKALSYLVIV